jgi:hypothetical protein
MARRLLGNPIKALSEVMRVTEFTDGGGTSGFKDMAGKLPIGAIVLGWKAEVSGGFAGDTTATMNVGKSGAVGAYSVAATQSCFAAGRKHMSVPVATSFEDAAVAPRLTITGTADFTSIVTNGLGKLRLTVYYLDTNAKAI